MDESNRDKLKTDFGKAKYKNNRQNNGVASQLTFNNYKGIYVKRWFIYSGLFCLVSLAIAVGFLIGFLVACNKERSLGYSKSKNDSVVEHETCLGCGIKPYVRLPRSLVPISYNVQLQPFLLPDMFHFDGNVSIIISCSEPTNNISLHINDITVKNETVQVSSLKLDNSLDSNLQIKSMERDLERQFFIVHLSNPLEASKSFTISMQFKGNLNTDLVGFYRSSYEENNEKRWLAATQFQPTDARRAFPCFDEPELKATFKISILHWANMTALSNMPVERTENRGEWVLDEFQETVRMSTYLLAFVVGDLDVARHNDSKPAFGVWTKKNQISTAKYALDIGPKILRHYEEFFNVSFPLPKTDMVAVPDFNAGAMENWGLILYRETAMLYDPKIMSIFNKMRVATVVAHELAHQWFGNLVTPKWWDDLWLNEGFASYVEYEGVDSVHPDWNVFHQFVSEVQDVFELDSLNTSHPISVKVKHPVEIKEVFDGISYGKGAAIIRMMNYILGPETFRKGVSNYLKALMFKNAEQDDLWHHLTAAQSDKTENFVDVKRVMDSWTLQAGYPVVTLTRNYDQNTAKISQKRFILNSEVEEALLKAENRRWEVPVSLTNEVEKQWDPKTRLWLTKDNDVLEIPKEHVPGPQKWMIANLQQAGFYRVNYDLTNWNLLVEQLNRNHKEIHVINRAQMIDDMLDLARSGYVPYTLALNATRYLKKEEEDLPWDSAISGISILDLMFCRASLYGNWMTYIKKLLRPNYLKYGWEIKNRKSLVEQRLQNQALGWTCAYEDEQCVREARVLFDKWRNATTDDNPIEPNMRLLVYCTAVRHGDEEEWAFVWQQYLKTKVASERDKLLRALGCTKQPWLLNRYLSWVFNESSQIRRQDGPTLIESVAGNNYGRDIAFNFVRQNWEQLVTYFGTKTFSFGKIIKSVSSRFTTEFELQELKAFSKSVSNNMGSSRRSFQQAIETVEANVQWMKKHNVTIDKWLRENQNV